MSFFFVWNVIDSLLSSTNFRLHLLLSYSSFDHCFVILHIASYLLCVNSATPTVVRTAQLTHAWN
jgi:hypothetical protein